MKFVPMKWRGGDYLVVAGNVACLRTHENGQTQVGIVGGAPLLVAGSIEERSHDIGGLIPTQFRLRPAFPALSLAPRGSAWRASRNSKGKNPGR